VSDPRELFGRMVFDADKALARHKIPDWDASGTEVNWGDLSDQEREDCMFTGAHIAAGIAAARDTFSSAP
jgi:hypothetical protein